MSIAVRPPMSLAAFLDWEERQDTRWEFDGVRPVGMNGGTVAHDLVTFNVRKLLDSRQGAGSCRPYGPNVKVATQTTVRYPDVVVSCTRQAPSATVIDNPVIVFEVASRSTGRRDVIDKNREYRGVASIQRYVVLEQERPLAIVFARSGATWTCEFVSGDDAELPLPEIGISVPLAEVYAGIEFIPEADTDED